MFLATNGVARAEAVLRQNSLNINIKADYLLPEDWRIVQLGQLGAISGGGTPSTKVSEYWDGDIAWVTPSDVTKCKGIYISDTGRKITKGLGKN